MDIFDYHAQKASDATRPLAERMRPRDLDEFVGQRQVVAAGSIIRTAIEQDRIFSMILWGPPGCGKPPWPESLPQLPVRSLFIFRQCSPV